MKLLEKVNSKGSSEIMVKQYDSAKYFLRIICNIVSTG